MNTAFQLRSQLADGYQRGKPVRSRRYLHFISKQASVVSGFGPCDPCHTGPHGGGQKSSDLTAIPLTRKEHREYGAAPYTYAKIHKLDIAAVTAELKAKFEANGGTY